jgi:hypothetical protein
MGITTHYAYSCGAQGHAAKPSASKVYIRPKALAT